MIIFITGLPGSGKSTVGKQVADKLGWAFHEVDDALTESMKAHIKEGKLLTDEELDEWLLERTVKIFTEHVNADKDLVVAGMSGYVKHKERILEQFPALHYVNLVVPFEVLKNRIKDREHFAGTDILEQCWEGKADVYAHGVGVDAEQGVDKVVEDCAALVASFNLMETQ